MRGVSSARYHRPRPNVPGAAGRMVVRGRVNRPAKLGTVKLNHTIAQPEPRTPWFSWPSPWGRDLDPPPRVFEPQNCRDLTGRFIGENSSISQRITMHP